MSIDEDGAYDKLGADDDRVEVLSSRASLCSLAKPIPGIIV